MEATLSSAIYILTSANRLTRIKGIGQISADLKNGIFCWLGHHKMSFSYPSSHEQGRGQYTSCYVNRFTVVCGLIILGLKGEVSCQILLFSIGVHFSQFNEI